MIRSFFLLFLAIASLYSWESSKIFIPPYENNRDPKIIYTGLDVLELADFKILENKKIGLVINHTSVNRFSSHLLDLLKVKNNINIKKIFTPEHGLKGRFSAGEIVKSSYDFKNNIEIISLYGKNKKPKSKDLSDIDLIIYDIQDIGSRYYTYISTMTYMMESCAENNLPFIVLDRPNPLGGEYIRGPILEKEFSSFVGMHPIPVVHGMTSGELAIMINELNWINSKLDLTIIPVINWQRKENYNGPLASWIPPSPNILDLETAKLYTGLCLIEGTNISEGRGTYSPFKIIGAPFINFSEKFYYNFKLDQQGIEIKELSFTPNSIEEMSKWPKFENKKCNGYKLSLEKKNNYDAFRFTVELLFYLNKEFPDNFKFLESNFIDKLYGSDKLRNEIINNGNINSLIQDWEDDQVMFKKQRSKFLIYN